MLCTWAFWTFTSSENAPCIEKTRGFCTRQIASSKSNLSAFECQTRAKLLVLHQLGSSS